MGNILIVTDFEGMPNITSLFDSEAYEIYFDEIKKLSKQILSMGFQPYICDVHNSGKCLQGKEIENITIYRGISKIDFSIQYGFAILAGFHGMEGHEGVWTHTFTSEIEKAFLEDVECGEITFFCNWLSSKGVGVRAVLGVNGIEEEAIRMNIPYCVVSNRTGPKDDMWSFLSKVTEFKAYYSNKTESEIKVKLKNKEICDFLRMKSLYVVQNDCICFNNLDELIYSIEDLCVSINKIKSEIISRNINFVMALKKKNTKEYECLKGLSLLNKGLDELTKEDLLYIQQIIENENYKKCD